ncbi:MAG TPA: acyl-CoA dehydrogenase family protein, partial [Terrimesophilobacter sp.]|nr:acyl-CoA dehydrogenase family protein [Terrimesophilobacter sp.]
ALLPLDTPGVEVRPLRQINGRTEFSEVFFDGARAARDNIVGPVGDGWQIAKSLLDFERGAERTMARSATIRAATRIMIGALPETRKGDTGIVRQLGRSAAECLGAEINTLRLLGTQMAGGEPGALSALVKLHQSEFWRSASAENVRSLGPSAFLADQDHFEKYLDARYGTIASGTSEIQRDIVARRVLNLPM